MWRKWILSLRVLRRVKEEYGEHNDTKIGEETNPFINQKKTKGRVQADVQRMSNEKRSKSPSADDDPQLYGGGFLLDDEAAQNLPEESELTVEIDNHVDGHERSNVKSCDASETEGTPTEKQSKGGERRFSARGSQSKPDNGSTSKRISPRNVSTTTPVGGSKLDDHKSVAKSRARRTPRDAANSRGTPSLSASQRGGFSEVTSGSEEEQSENSEFVLPAKKVRSATRKIGQRRSEGSVRRGRTRQSRRSVMQG